MQIHFGEASLLKDYIFLICEESNYFGHYSLVFLMIVENIYFPFPEMDISSWVCHVDSVFIWSLFLMANNLIFI